MKVLKSVSIEWIDPKNKPEHSNMILLSLCVKIKKGMSRKKEDLLMSVAGYYFDGKFKTVREETIKNSEVKAWSEMPEVYQDDPVKEEPVIKPVRQFGMTPEKEAREKELIAKCKEVGLTKEEVIELAGFSIYHHWDNTGKRFDDFILKHIQDNKQLFKDLKEKP